MVTLKRKARLNHFTSGRARPLVKWLRRAFLLRVTITEIQNLLSNSKVRNVIHSGRITFRVLTNYIPRFDELQSAVVANYNPRSRARPTP